MLNEKHVLFPAVAELIDNISGMHSAPFWDGIREVSGTSDTVRKIKHALESLYSVGKTREAYDLIAVEVPTSIVELEPYPEAITAFLHSILLDIDDLMYDYDYEDQASNK